MLTTNQNILAATLLQPFKMPKKIRKCQKCSLVHSVFLSNIIISTNELLHIKIPIYSQVREVDILSTPLNASFCSFVTVETHNKFHEGSFLPAQSTVEHCLIFPNGPLCSLRLLNDSFIVCYICRTHAT